MSKSGIKKVAKLFSNMQQLRVELLRSNCDRQDIMLSHMLMDGNDAMKDQFCKITQIEEGKTR